MTAEWLRHYVYERIKPKDGKDATLATLGTNLISAFWHGFYPVYYSTFFFLAILAEVGKDVYRLKHLFPFVPYPFYQVLNNLLILTSLNWFCSGMALLEMNKAIFYYKRYYFGWHLLMIGAFVTLRFVLLPNFKKRKPIKKD